MPACFSNGKFMILGVAITMASSSKRLTFSPTGVTPKSKSRKKASGKESQLLQTNLQVSVAWNNCKYMFCMQ